jgi:hypothetical protein
MFKQSKWQLWYDAQPEHVKRWMDQPRAIWYDSDMWKAFAVGIFIGVLVGVAI